MYGENVGFSRCTYLVNETCHQTNFKFHRSPGFRSVRAEAQKKTFSFIE